ncbi:hypothetical protein [Nitratifractor sp.]
MVLDIDDHMLPEGFEYYAVPTFFIVDSHGKLLDRAVGGIDARGFLGYLQRFVK